MIVDPDFPDHWKTRMLVDELDGDEAAPVYLLRLWAHCQNRRTCVFENLPQAALKALCRFPGHANKFESSLAASGFVRRENQSLIVIGWEEYNASLIANWNNGKLGGRPKKEPKPNPREPMGNPWETHGEPIREDKRREEKNTPYSPPRGTVRMPPKKSDNIPASQPALRIAELFRRRPTTPWSAKEIKAFKALGPIDPEALEEVCRYTESERAKGENGRHRRDLCTFLNNFNGEVDRARAKPGNGHEPSKPIQFID